MQDSLTAHMATVSGVFNGLLFIYRLPSTLLMYLPNLKSVALPVPEIIGVPPKTGESLDTPTVPFLEIF